MPKVAMTVAQKQQMEDREADTRLKRRIRATMGVLDMTGEGMALRLGMSCQTFYRRMKEPGSFTLSEMRAFERLAARARTMTGDAANV